MGSFNRAIGEVVDGGSLLRDASRSASSTWNDSVRDRFEAETIEPMLQLGRRLEKDLQSSAAAIESALRSLGGR